MNKKLKNPDLTRFGFYLYPKVYKGTMGFEKAHGLLFLDSSGRIESSVAKEIGLVRLLNSSTAVLYAINPVGGRYPNASELLKALSLGSVAKQRLITKEELRREFLEQCSQSNIMIDLLDKAVRLGVNKDGYVVYESKSGRYIVDDKGVNHRDVSSEELLYAVDDDGELIDDKVEYCLESLFKFHLNIQEHDLDFIDAGDFNNFVQTIVRRPPPPLPKMGDYTPISFYTESESISIGAKTARIISVFEKLEARLMLDFDFDDDAAFEQFFHHTYNRNLPSTSHGFKSNMPAPLLIMLLKHLNFNLIDKPHIYAPSVGSAALLAGLVKLERCGAKITACERLVDKQELFNDFLDEIGVDGLVVHKHASVEDFDGSIGYLMLGDEANAVLIPDSDSHTYKKNIVQMLDLLSRRSAGGRSIFISPVDSEGSLGYLDEDSTLFIRHLYQNYQNVLIFDCNQVLSYPNRNTCEYRVYIVGEYVDDYSLMNTEDLAELVVNPKIQTVDTPEDFYLICARYASEIAAVEISSVDLMGNLMDIIADDEDENSGAPEAAEVSLDKSQVESSAEATPEENDGATSKEGDTDDADAKSDQQESEQQKVEADKEDLPADDEQETSSDNESEGKVGGKASGGGRGSRLTNELAPDAPVAKGKTDSEASTTPDDTEARAKKTDDVELDSAKEEETENNIIVIGGEDSSEEELTSNDPEPELEPEFEYDDPDIEFDDPDIAETNIEQQNKTSGMRR